MFSKRSSRSISSFHYCSLAAIPILPAEGFILNVSGVTETGLAGRALHGEPPGMCAGLEPSVVAERRLVRAIEDDERDVPASAFTP